MTHQPSPTLVVAAPSPLPNNHEQEKHEDLTPGLREEGSESVPFLSANVCASFSYVLLQRYWKTRALYTDNEGSIYRIKLRQHSEVELMRSRESRDVEPRF